jgi:hypothetical protein
VEKQASFQQFVDRRTHVDDRGIEKLDVRPRATQQQRQLGAREHDRVHTLSRFQPIGDGQDLGTRLRQEVIFEQLANVLRVNEVLF